GWLRFIKSRHPHLVPRLSTAKSPQQMFGAVMKSYFAEMIGVKPENLVTISVMPCVAKKEESKMELFYEEYAGNDVDVVLTTRELNRMIRTAHIDTTVLKERACDLPMQEGTGAGVIFGTTGGVMEAALRSAYYIITGSNPEPDAFSEVRSTREREGYKEAVFKIGDAVIKTAVVSGLQNIEYLLELLESGKVQYDFVEVMACPGGCSGGGGQPIHDGMELATPRGKYLYELDEKASIRYSHENVCVNRIYREFFEKPLSHKAHMLLHTDHNSWEMP
ncbi:MAG TPA: [Fe-Fe] hydrogenase large subunit C-terminal domain-containing protein, partial [Lachnospiraceae bacterium]|nr:[Fe-Fe] hydrogenase large subunit C-terminal domain-containing protein [Lachnospiraceae bacterium]